MTIESAAASGYAETFAARRDGLPGHGLPWLSELREAGMARFQERGLPGPRWEAWKYTSLRALEKIGFAPADGSEGAAAIAAAIAAAAVDAALIEAAAVDRAPSLLPSQRGCHRLVFVDGRLHPGLSSVGRLPAGATLEPLAQALARDPEALAPALGRIAVPDGQPMLALNTALMEDGLVLRLAPGTVLDKPVEAVFLGGLAERPLAYHPRLLVLLERDSRASLVEHHLGLGEGPYFANSVSEIRLDERARLDHVKVQSEGAAAFHLATGHVGLGGGAHYRSFSLALGARLSRNEISVRLEGDGAWCRLDGAYLMRGEQHCDNTTLIEHLVPGTACREVFKGVLDDRSRGVFQGRIVVHRGAVRTNGHQLNKTLLLSDRAEIDAKPELEIYADDVKCSHGATVGELDPGALFYMRSRGLAEATARRLLIEAFLAETFAEVQDIELFEAVHSRISGWLAGAKGETR